MTGLTLSALTGKPSRLVIGLMSGTSADGLDAALVEISGAGPATRVRQLAFLTRPYSPEERREILRLAEGREGGSADLCRFSFWLGEVSADVCVDVCGKAGIDPSRVDLVGSHGQTLYHIPSPGPYLGRSFRSTLQLGEASVIAERLGCPVVSDFRVRDMAAGGQGAPLVPYAEYLLYRRADETVGLQNIGGIGNLTVLPAGGAPEDTVAFDTGPGNMVMDQLTGRLTGGRQRFDEDGRLAAQGRVHSGLLAWMMDDPYLDQKPPKTTGRERYGAAYVDALTARAEELGASPLDAIATAARFTAECVRTAAERFSPAPLSRLIVGGGGCRNPVLMDFLRRALPCPVLTNEDLGLDSDAKEAVAFAILANECVHGLCSNVPSVTGARHPVVMGKISW